MKLSEIIAKLQIIMNDRGDLPGYVWDSDAQSFFPVERVDIINDPIDFVVIRSEFDEGEIHPPRRQ